MDKIDSTNINRFLLFCLSSYATDVTIVPSKLHDSIFSNLDHFFLDKRRFKHEIQEDSKTGMTAIKSQVTLFQRGGD